MKKYLLAFAFLSAWCASSMAQSTTPPAEDKTALNCYLKWLVRFEERGAEEIADGTYTDVIITIRNPLSDVTDCFNGKAVVKDGKVMAMYLRFEDGTYELIKRKPKYEQKDLPISNGMSKAFVTAEGELINVLFVMKIKPKKKGYAKAVEPMD